MSLFGAIVKTLVNVATLPVDIVVDITAAPISDKPLGARTKAKLQQIKDDADE